MSGDSLEKAIKSAEEGSKRSVSSLTEQEAVARGLKLIEESTFCLLGTNNEDGFPNIKGMTNLKSEGLKKIWFSTNTSSRRVQQLMKDNRACVYYVAGDKFRGLMLVGTVEILQDLESKKMLWSDGAEIYYPLGVEDPDYSVLYFTTRWGNYYEQLHNISFTVE